MKLLVAFQLLLPGMPFIYYGDEVGMTGGHDPDCRRGMLWDEARQDKDMLSYYRRLIQLRKAYPVLTQGDAERTLTEDDNALVCIQRGDMTLLFHAGEGKVAVREYAGQMDLLTQQEFDGILGAYAVAVLKQ